VFGDTANAVWRDQESRTRTANLLYSIGLSADSAGKITYIQWDGPAFKAKLNTSLTITGVNGQSYSPERLRAAVAASINQPVDLLIRFQDEFRTVRLDYNGGHRYPRLERIAGKPALIDDILAAR